MAKNALKSKIYAQLRMSALYLVNFQVKITKKTHCPKSSSTATDGPPVLTSPLLPRKGRQMRVQLWIQPLTPAMARPL